MACVKDNDIEHGKFATVTLGESAIKILRDKLSCQNHEGKGIDESQDIAQETLSDVADKGRPKKRANQPDFNILTQSSSLSIQKETTHANTEQTLLNKSEIIQFSQNLSIKIGKIKGCSSDCSEDVPFQGKSLGVKINKNGSNVGYEFYGDWEMRADMKTECSDIMKKLITALQLELDNQETADEVKSSGEDSNLTYID